LFKHLARTSIVSVLIGIAVTAALTGTANAGVTTIPGVTRVVHGSVNVEQAFRVTHCIIHYEFGTFDGTAYAKARATHEDRGYACTTEIQVVAARGGQVVSGPRSLFTCGETIRRSCLPGVYLKWARSSLGHATGFGAYIKVNENLRWPRTWQMDRITLTAF